MDLVHDSSTGVTHLPPVPEEGLAEVLGTWAGRGYLWDALSTPDDIHESRKWTPRDIRCRAHRVLLERLAPALKRWPTRLATWVDLLPATKVQTRAIRDVPFGGVSWSATRARFGWPPTKFVGRESERRADMLVVTTLRWAIELLSSIRADAQRAYPDIDLPIRDQLDAATALLDIEPVRAAGGAEPARPEIVALRSEGSPWGAVAEVADELRVVGASMNELATRLLLPDEEIRWRLFHLGTLGVLLRALRKEGCQITSLRPFGALSHGPAYDVVDADGQHWDLWFEASGVWSYEGVVSPYSEAAGYLLGAGRPLGADLMLIRRDERALILECKYSANPDVVARDGYYQATTYAAEIRSRLTSAITSFVVCPEGIVSGSSSTTMLLGEIGVIPPSGIGPTVHRFLNKTTSLPSTI